MVAIVLNTLLCATGILIAACRKEADKGGRFVKDLLFAIGVPLLAGVLVVIGISFAAIRSRRARGRRIPKHGGLVSDPAGVSAA